MQNEEARMQKSNRCGSNKNCFFILHSAFIICFGFGRAVSRILSAPCGGENHLSVQPIPGIHPLSRKWSGPLRDSLFGLAPDGVFRAASLALRAVVSYTTFSPLPAALAKHRRFNFLWHCPSNPDKMSGSARVYPGRTSPGYAASRPMVFGLSSPGLRRERFSALPKPRAT